MARGMVREGEHPTSAKRVYLPQTPCTLWDVHGAWSQAPRTLSEVHGTSFGGARRLVESSPRLVGSSQTQIESPHPLPSSSSTGQFIPIGLPHPHSSPVPAEEPEGCGLHVEDEGCAPTKWATVCTRLPVRPQMTQHSTQRVRSTVRQAERAISERHGPRPPPRRNGARRSTSDPDGNSAEQRKSLGNARKTALVGPVHRISKKNIAANPEIHNLCPPVSLPRQNDERGR